MDIVAIVGAVSGVISFFGLIYVLGFKFGKIETEIKNMKEKLIDPIEFGQLKNQVDTLYQIFVSQSISKANSHGNPKKIEIEIPDELIEFIKEKTMNNLDRDSIDIVKDIFKDLGAKQEPYFINLIKQIALGRLVEEIREDVEKIQKERK